MFSTFYKGFLPDIKGVLSARADPPQGKCSSLQRALVAVNFKPQIFIEVCVVVWMKPRLILLHKAMTVS